MQTTRVKIKINALNNNDIPILLLKYSTSGIYFDKKRIIKDIRNADRNPCDVSGE